MMFRIFAAAIAAGLLASALISAVEAFTTTPLIIEAETYEAAGGPAANDLGRFLNTFLANMVTGIAFSLLVVVGLTFGERRTDVPKGLMIAFCGFASFTLAPALGLPPDLPGMPAADLHLRQVWWACTVALSMGGLACLFITQAIPFKLLGVALLAAPHVWGAPQAATQESLVPATLAAQFAASSIVINALFWVLMGVFAPIFFDRFKGKADSPTP